MYEKNRILQMLEQKQIPLGMQCFRGDPILIEIMGLTGFDWVMLDSEHSGNNPRAKESLIRAAESVGIVPFVVVGETNDGYLNDIRGFHVTQQTVFEAIRNARGGPVDEGNVGAGTGTVAFGWKGGIGTSSRRLPATLGAYTVGVLVQTNFGGVLTIAGAPVGKELGQYYLREEVTQAAKDKADGSCMMIIATDAPVDPRNLKRLAARAWFGMARAGSSASNGSGDYAIAFSTAPQNQIHTSDKSLAQHVEALSNDAMSPLFLAVIEATEEAI